MKMSIIKFTLFGLIILFSGCQAQQKTKEAGGKAEYKCQLADQTEMHILSIRTRTSIQDLPAVFGKAYGSIMQYLGELGEHPAGPAFAAYHNMDIQNFDVEIGFPVSKKLPGKDDIQSGIISKGKSATCIYIGPYKEMKPAYDALMNYMKKNNLVPTGVAYEFYLNDPSKTPPRELQTKIVFPLLTGSVPPLAPSVSPLAELNLAAEPLAEKRLNVELIYSGGDQSGLCYLGAYAMLAKYNDNGINFTDVVVNSGIGAGAFYIPQANLLVFGHGNGTPKSFFLGSVVTAAKNQAFDYYVTALMGAQITSEFLARDLPEEAKGIFWAQDEDDAFNLLKRVISSGIPVAVHLDLAPIERPMSAHTSWAGKALQVMAHVDHYMTVTGYDKSYVYLNDPSEKAPGWGKDIPVGIAGFLNAWKNGNHQAFGAESRIGPYWMLFLGKRGTAKSVSELLSWNKQIAAKAPEEIRKAANKPNIMGLVHSNEMYRSRKEFGAFLQANGHQEAGSMFLQAADLLKGLSRSWNKKRDLLKLADLQEQALATW